MMKKVVYRDGYRKTVANPTGTNKEQMASKVKGWIAKKDAAAADMLGKGACHK
jgi:hypothetical protein